MTKTGRQPSKKIQKHGVKRQVDRRKNPIQHKKEKDRQGSLKKRKTGFDKKAGLQHREKRTTYEKEIQWVVEQKSVEVAGKRSRHARRPKNEQKAEKAEKDMEKYGCGLKSLAVRFLEKLWHDFGQG